MRLLLVHQQVVADLQRADEQDVLVQAEYVRSALTELGHTVETLPVEVGLDELRSWLRSEKPDCVVNLVESLAQSDARIVDVPLLLDELRIPYTGAPASALIATNHKVLAKQRMRDAGLPTPDWATVQQGELAPPYIVKSIEEHASFGLSAASVITTTNKHTRDEIGDANRFAEAFVDGREVNVSLLAGVYEPLVLPLAEIDFSAFAPLQPRIVDYAAKWDETSFEYHHTPRRFVDETAERALSRSLRDLAKRCWYQFGLRGYARVDFRVDGSGQPWILEVNCNPCLSPDAGFAAALERAGIAWSTAIARILADALTPSPRTPFSP